MNRIESDLNASETRVDLLSDNLIRTDEVMKTIQKTMEHMSVDVRAVRNSVLSTIVGASLVWVVGTAVTNLYGQNSVQHLKEKTAATVAKNA